MSILNPILFKRGKMKGEKEQKSVNNTGVEEGSIYLRIDKPLDS